MTETSIRTVPPVLPKRRPKRPRPAADISVYIPVRERLANAGFGSVSYVPVLFDARQRLLRIHDRFLRERARGEWPLKRETMGLKREDDLPRFQTLLSLAYSLSNWVQWCALPRRSGKGREDSLDWRDATYDHVLQYQRQMRTGAWSRDGRPLSPDTANRRADAAASFLSWAAHRGLRPPFEMKTTSVRRFFDTGTVPAAGNVTVRARVRRERPAVSKALSRALAIPQRDEVARWLGAVRARRGYAKYLTCRLIIETGLRRSEVAGLTIHDWPGQDLLDHLLSDGRTSEAVMRLLVTKGGRQRDVMVPLRFASEVRTWIDGPRLRLAHRHHKRCGRTPTALFVSDARGELGTPIAVHTIYDLFREVTPRPRVWHPHMARHYFACCFILQALETEARAYGKTMDQMGTDWVSSRGTWHLSLLRRHLGHVSEEITATYLRYLITATQVADLAAGWHSYLDAPCSEDEQ